MSMLQNLRAYRTQILVACIALGLAFWLGLSLWLGPKTPVATVVQRDFVQTVVASGRIESPHRVELGVQITGTVKAVPVNEGQIVVAAQPLIELEDAELADLGFEREAEAVFEPLREEPKSAADHRDPVA